MKFSLALLAALGLAPEKVCGSTFEHDMLGNPGSLTQGGHKTFLRTRDGVDGKHNLLVHAFYSVLVEEDGKNAVLEDGDVDGAVTVVPGATNLSAGPSFPNPEVSEGFLAKGGHKSFILSKEGYSFKMLLHLFYMEVPEDPAQPIEDVELDTIGEDSCLAENCQVRSTAEERAGAPAKEKKNTMSESLRAAFGIFELAKAMAMENALVLATLDKDTFDKDLKMSPEILLAAVTQDGMALKFAPKLRSERDFILEAMRRNGLALQFASEEFKSDREIVLDAVRQNGLALQFAGAELRSDREIVQPALWQNGLALQFVGAELQDDFFIVLAALHQNGLALQFVGADHFQSCRYYPIVSYAVWQNGLALQFAGAELRSDREIVWDAVKQNGLALQFASENLQSDAEIVRAANTTS